MVQVNAVAEYKRKCLTLVAKHFTEGRPATKLNSLLVLDFVSGIWNKPFVFSIDFQLAGNCVSFGPEVAGDCAAGRRVNIHNDPTAVVASGGDVLAIWCNIEEELICESFILSQKGEVLFHVVSDLSGVYRLALLAE